MNSKQIGELILIGIQQQIENMRDGEYIYFSPIQIEQIYTNEVQYEWETNEYIFQIQIVRGNYIYTFFRNRHTGEGGRTTGGLLWDMNNNPILTIPISYLQLLFKVKK